MIYGSSPKKDNNSFGGHSSAANALDLDKKRREEEAKKIRESHEAAQRQQEKTRLQLQIDNRKRELDRSQIDLRAKESKLAELKRRIDDAKRAQFVIKTQVKQKEGGVLYLQDENKATEKQIAAETAELEKIKAREASLISDIDQLKKKLVNHSVDLKQREVIKDSQVLTGKEREIEDLEREVQILGLDLGRLNRERDAKQQELKDLEIKRDAIRN